jgi:two-component system phosphate regulon sensor histidine kinase PhoR
MEIKRLNIIITLGFVAIIGILIAQLLWTRQAYNLEDQKFNQKVNIALLEVVKNYPEKLLLLKILFRIFLMIIM